MLAARAPVLAEHGPLFEALAHTLRTLEPDAAAALTARAAALEVELPALLALDSGLVELATGAQLERSLGLYVDGPRGPVLGGAWSLPPALARHVALRPLALDPPAAPQTPAWGFGLPGPFPFAGISSSGHALVTNLMRPAAPGPGIPGGVLLRELLAAPRVEQARARIESTAIADGRNWMLADGASFHGYEQLGATATLTRVGRKTGHVHANHCFDPSLRQREARPRSPLSFRRLELASTLYVMHRPDTAEAMLAFFAEVEAAAFSAPSQRAQCMIAIELVGGRALWRSGPGEAVQVTEFSTPFRS